MLLENIWPEKRLVNGATGLIEDIVWISGMLNKYFLHYLFIPLFLPSSGRIFLPVFFHLYLLFQEFSISQYFNLILMSTQSVILINILPILYAYLSTVIPGRNYIETVRTSQ